MGLSHESKSQQNGVSSMVVAVKNGKVRICIDPRDLNNAILREHHPIKTVEDVASNGTATTKCTAHIKTAS